MLHEPLKPMLLYSSPTVPAGQYMYQLKFDGHRTLLHKEGENISMFTRQGTHCTAQYPEVAAGAAIGADNVILDGEMIVMGADGKPCFDSLMERFSAKKSINRLANKMPAHFVAFDILYLNGKDVTKLPIEKRLSLLQDVAASSEAMSVCRSSDDGESLFEAVKTMGLEGIVSKKKHSVYQMDTRSAAWVKTKNYLYETVQIAGIRKGGKFGWLLQLDGRYLGVMELTPLAARHAFAAIAPKIKTSEDKHFVFVKPLIRCRVKFQCYTKKGLLRSPSFMKFVS
ncbi:RNA ligase family protein [Paenibacillus thermotolerans]|uniref:ATP-dependent DNA ligase n=1 Tax=Paenibacillus thermotolerans TaxID=3027807 RepID=UPI0023684FFC|nr:MULTISPECIES: RNA ligase family protein [unclassified Paenibacillus]